MAIFSISRCSSFFLIFTFWFAVALAAKPTSSFSFAKFEKNPKLDSQIALFGDAEIVSSDSSLKLTRSVISSTGRVMYRKPIQIFERNSRKRISFSTYFSFSVSPGSGHGIAFIIIPVSSPVQLHGNGVLAVKFDPNLNHVSVSIGSRLDVKTGNVSAINSVLKSGEKLHFWIDYDGRLKRLEVRLSKSDVAWPLDPSISCTVDLLGLCKDGAFMGISSSSGNSTQSSNLYSWSFYSWSFVNRNEMHSYPVDPRAFVEQPEYHSRCCRISSFLRILVAIIFATGCGAVVAALVMFMWSVFVDRPPMVPSECAVHPVEFGYEKIITVGGKGADAVKK